MLGDIFFRIIAYYHLIENIMLKKTFFILVILIIGSCRKPSNDLQNQENKINPSEAKKVKKHNSLFLGLNPYMTEYDFSTEISNLNSQNKLNNGRFIIPVNNQDYYFDVKKTINTIRLTYSDQTSKSVHNLSYRISDEHLQLYENKINDLLKIFNSKYNGEEKVIPTEVNLSYYGLRKEHYRIFQDSSKTVLIGYTINGYRCPSPSEQAYENSKKKKEKTPDHPLENIGKFIDRENQSSNFVIFGLEVDIDYYYNDEFNKLFQKIIYDNEVKKKSEIINKQKEIERKKVSENNLNEL